MSTAVLFSLLQSLLFRHCDSVAAQHAVSGAHQHAVECSLRDVEKMFLQVLVRMCFTMVGLQTNSLLIAPTGVHHLGRDHRQRIFGLE